MYAHACVFFFINHGNLLCKDVVEKLATCRHVFFASLYRWILMLRTERNCLKLKGTNAAKSEHSTDITIFLQDNCIGGQGCWKQKPGALAAVS